MSRQEQLELQSSSGATHQQETAGCSAESPSRKGSQTFPMWKPRLPATTTSQNKEAHKDSLSRSCQETGHGLRPYTCFPAPSGHTRSESQWLSFALFPQLTWVSQPAQGPYRGCQGAFCLQPHAGSGLPRRKVSPTFPCAPSAKRGVHRPGLTDAWKGDSAPQPVGNHPHRTQPAASHPTSGSLSISIHRAQYLQPLCASSSTDPNPRHQDTVMGL